MIALACVDSSDANAVLNARYGKVTYTAVTGIHIRLGSTTPTASTPMTELPGTGGYTTGGTLTTWNSASAQAITNSGTPSWIASGTSWSIVGIEIWDIAGTPLRHSWGTWTGQPISITSGNTFGVAAAAVVESLT